jgi:hypothetical protein
MYHGIEAAQGAIAFPMIVFSKKFIPKADKSMEIFLNILQVALGFGTPTYFNTCKFAIISNHGVANFRLPQVMKPLANKMGQGYKTATDNLKDYTGASSAFAVGAAKDFNKNLAASELTNLTEKIQGILSTTAKSWKESLTLINEATFSGEESSLRMLDKLLQNGNSVRRQPGRAIDYETSSTKFLFSAILPDTWRMQSYYPVLLDTAWDCKTQGIGVRQWTKRKNVLDLAVCLNDRQYQMWAVKGDYRCKPPSNQCGVADIPCENYLTELPGLSYLQQEQETFGNMSMISLANR